MEAAPVCLPRKKGLRPEHEREHPKPVPPRRFVEREEAFVAPRHVQHRRQIDLEELFGDRTRAPPVEPPDRAVREDAPAQATFRHHVGATEIAEHLGRGRGHRAVAGRAAVERPAPALALDDGESQAVALLLRQVVGALLGGLICEQQAIRHMRASVRGKPLLPEARFPAKQLQHGTDQIGLGLRLVGRAVCRETIEQCTEICLKPFKRVIVDRLPVLGLHKRAAQVSVSEQLSLKGIVEFHPDRAPSDSLQSAKVLPACR